MWDRHRRRSFRRLAVDLGVVTVANSAHVAAQPDAAYWEATIAVAFGNARFLQQQQRIAASADEDEFRGNRMLPALVDILDLDAPAVVCVAFKPNNAVFVVHREAGLRDEVRHQ